MESRAAIKVLTWLGVWRWLGWYVNQRQARNVCYVLKERKIRINRLFDVGANESQFAIPFQKMNPCEVISFEPNCGCSPIGKVYRLALGEEKGMATFRLAGQCSHITGPGVDVPVCRFDELYPFVDDRGAMLKVDAENCTLDVLVGCGEVLSKFSAVVVEMWNHHDKHETAFFLQRNNQMEINDLMCLAGFNYCEVVNTSLQLQPRLRYYDMVFTR